MGDFVFDLPFLDDSNSILLPDSPPAEKIVDAIVKDVEKKDAIKEEIKQDVVPADEEKTSITVEMMRPSQMQRLPIAWNFEKAFESKSTTGSLPIVSIPECKLLVHGSKLRPQSDLMPSADLMSLDDSAIPFYLVTEERPVAAATVNWKNSLLNAQAVSIHNCALRFANLHDPTHDGSPKIDIATNSAKIPIDRMSDAVLTSTHDSLSPHSFQSALTENPLLNTFITTAMTDSWLDVSPHMLRNLIDLVIYRYRQAFPGARQNKDKDFAQYCVEDTTASTASFSVVLPATERAQENTYASYTFWKTPEYYYRVFAPTLAASLVGKFINKPATSVVDDTVKPVSVLNRPPEQSLAALEAALASQSSVHVTSMHDTAKGVSAMQNSFVHPDTKKDADKVVQRDEAKVHLAVMNDPTATFIDESSTFSANFDALYRLETRRREPTSDLDELVRVSAEKTAATPEAPSSPETFMISKMILTGHFSEWKTLIGRVKEQIRDAPRELQSWLGAMLWMIVHFCKIRDNYKHPDGHYVSQLVGAKDETFLRFAIGQNLADLFADERLEKVEGHSKGMENMARARGFFKRFFWHNPKTDRVGGLAMLFFPFETSLFFTIPNKDPVTKVLTPNHNGALLRTLHTLVPHGFAASDVFDVRTSCSYVVNSMYWQTKRTITFGVVGYLAQMSHFAARQRNEEQPILMRVVIAAIDNVTSVVGRELVHRLPEVDPAIDNRLIIDRSLERFVQFPFIKKGENGKFFVAVEQRAAESRAGFDVSQVANSLSASRLDEQQTSEIMQTFIDDFKTSRQETVAQVLARREKERKDAEKQKEDKAQQEANNKALENADKKKEKQDLETAELEKQKNAAAEAERKRIAQQEKKAEAKRKAGEEAKAKKKADKIAAAEAKKARDAKKAKQVTPPASRAPKNNQQLSADEKLARDLQKEEFFSSNTDNMDGFIQVSRNKKKKMPPLLETPSTVVTLDRVDEQPSVAAFIMDFSKQTTDHTVQIDTAQKDATAENNLVVGVHNLNNLVFSPIDTVKLVVGGHTLDNVVLSSIDAVSLPADSVAVSPIENVTCPSADNVPLSHVENTTVSLVDNVALSSVETVVVAENTTVDVPAAVADSVTVSDTVAVSDAVADTVAVPDAVEDSVTVSDSVAVSDAVATAVENTAVENAVTVPAAVAESPHTPKSAYFVLDGGYRVDPPAQMRCYHSLRSNIQHVRLWLQLAARDRPFSHRKNVLLANRVEFTAEQATKHLLQCADESVSLLTPWAVLATAFDRQVDNTLPGASLTSLIINGASTPDPNFAILSNVGEYIFKSVVNNAHFTHSDSGANGACYTCLMCQRTSYSRFSFVPEYIDDKHTVVCRLVPLCDSQHCSSLLLYKVGNRTHSDGCARFPGLRVFFHFNGTVTVCESESDIYKLNIGISNGINLSKPTGNISNSDFAATDNCIFVTDAQGYVFALPIAVAQKAFDLARFLMTDVNQN